MYLCLCRKLAHASLSPPFLYTILLSSAANLPYNQARYSTLELEALCDEHIPRLLRLLETGSENDLGCSEEDRTIYEVRSEECE